MSPAGFQLGSSPINLCEHGWQFKPLDHHGRFYVNVIILTNRDCWKGQGCFSIPHSNTFKGSRAEWPLGTAAVLEETKISHCWSFLAETTLYNSRSWSFLLGTTKNEVVSFRISEKQEMTKFISTISESRILFIVTWLLQLAHCTSPKVFQVSGLYHLHTFVNCWD